MSTLRICKKQQSKSVQKTIVIKSDGGDEDNKLEKELIIIEDSKEKE